MNPVLTNPVAYAVTQTFDEMLDTARETGRTLRDKLATGVSHRRAEASTLVNGIQDGLRKAVAEAPGRGSKAVGATVAFADAYTRDLMKDLVEAKTWVLNRMPADINAYGAAMFGAAVGVGALAAAVVAPDMGSDLMNSGLADTVISQVMVAKAQFVDTFNTIGDQASSLFTPFKAFFSNLFSFGGAEQTLTTGVGPDVWPSGIEAPISGLDAAAQATPSVEGGTDFAQHIVAGMDTPLPDATPDATPAAPPVLETPVLDTAPNVEMPMAKPDIQPDAVTMIDGRTGEAFQASMTPDQAVDNLGNDLGKVGDKISEGYHALLGDGAESEAASSIVSPETSDGVAQEMLTEAATGITSQAEPMTEAVTGITSQAEPMAYDMPLSQAAENMGNDLGKVGGKVLQGLQGLADLVGDQTSDLKIESNFDKLFNDGGLNGPTH